MERAPLTRRLRRDPLPKVEGKAVFRILMNLINIDELINVVDLPRDDETTEVGNDESNRPGWRDRG